MLPKDPPIVTLSNREVRWIEEKARQRKAMREYIIKERSNPFRQAASQGQGYIEDPAMVRFDAQNSFLSEITYFRPTFRSVRLLLGIVVAPVIAIAFVSEYYRQGFEAKCRRGEVSYRDRNNKFV